MVSLKQLSLSQQSYIRPEVFPLVVTTEGISITKYLADNRNEIDELLRAHKGILFRNCDINTVQDFHDAIEATSLDGMDYLGGAAVRTQLTSRVFTANESPASEKIPFHHEMSQVPSPPTHLFFYCETPPEIGGKLGLFLLICTIDTTCYLNIYAIYHTI